MDTFTPLYASYLTDAEWHLLEPVLPPDTKSGDTVVECGAVLPSGRLRSKGRRRATRTRVP